MTFFFLNDFLFLYLAIDTVFHPSGIIQNGRRKLLSKSHVQTSNYMMKLFVFFSFQMTLNLNYVQNLTLDKICNCKFSHDNFYFVDSNCSSKKSSKDSPLVFRGI